MNGYLTIDLEKRKIDDNEVTPIDGLYNKVKNANKPVVFFNYKTDYPEYNKPFYCNCIAPNTTGNGIVVGAYYSNSNFVPIVVYEDNTIKVEF